MKWMYKSYEELTKQELHDMIKARIDVFVVEQNCPYPEVDGYDPEANHLWLEDQHGKIIAYCRLFLSGVKYSEASIGRILVLKEMRGKGYAKKLMTRALSVIKDQYGEQAVKIQAQEYLLDFYGSFGFEGVTEIYLEDGIPHVDMVLHY
ncbi:GNAT family N-acetyltransferase [Pontibacillus sp. HMF3514]|uniref:GNAT family N-acetyltransferase n=1 Tax=Pontibacillus sp. HMF3514 TaxID=2692425 RepID=UPI00131F8058|nr:GNAT family N-acetyltransferase [Pontibacillus sp. HMF3514]QHE50774.1 GNAT family N-acetyltransferase [Pontibacillus sp. HMF3514]